MDGTGHERNEKKGTHLVNYPQPPRCRITQISVMAMLVMLVGLLSVCTWYFAYSCPRLAVIRLSETRRKEILNSTVEYLDDLFQWNAYGAQALVALLDKDLLGDAASLESFGKIRGAAWSLFKAIPLITSIGVTSTTGLTGLYVRGGMYPGDLESDTGQTGPLFMYTKSTEEFPAFYIESVDEETGEAVGEPTEYYFKVHLKNRPWFRRALSIPLGEKSWHLEKSELSGKPYIHCGIPVVPDISQQLAVVHSSHSTKAITEYLSSALDLRGGTVFVSNELGEVLFSSEEDCVSRDVSICNDHAEAVKFIETQTQLKNLMKGEILDMDVTIGGRKYFINTWAQSIQGMKLAVVIMIPSESFWGAMDMHTRLALIAILMLALGLTFVGCGLIYLLMERISAETKLRVELLRNLELKQRAEASRDAKTAFLSHMSHELRTPMACIIGLLEILMGELKMSEHESSVKQVHRCATSLVTLLNTALDIAKVEAGKLELENVEFDLETELSSLIDVFSVQCDAKGLHLSLQLSDDIPKLVIGDPARVMQIFTNLIGNSIKFTPMGRIIVRGWVQTPELELGDGSASPELGIEDKNQLVMMFEVDDTGRGIDKALRERVFENFVQGDASTPRTHGGTGLGLGIVRSVVHLMGGEIRIADKPGNGSLFQFSLCFGLPFEDVSPELHRVKSRLVYLGMPEQDCRDVVATWLEDRGLTVHQSGSWEEILRHLKHVPLPLCAPRIEEDSDKITQEEDSRWGRNGCSLGRTASGSVVTIRRSKSDGTDGRREKPVLIVDVDLLPEFHDERDYLQTLEKFGLPLRTHPSGQVSSIASDCHALVWVTASNTPAAFKRVLKLVARSILVRRPLHASRLRDLFHQLESRDEELRQLDGIAVNVVPSALSLKIAKQLGELYIGDEAPLCVDCMMLGAPCQHCACPIHDVESNDGGIPQLEADGTISVPIYSQQAGLGGLVRSKSDNVAKLKIPRPRPPKALERLEILVAEDHVLLRRLAATMLRKLGAVPFEVCDGQEAVNAVVARVKNGLPPFHCILMDCQMPVMDGYDACRAVREFEADKKQHTCVIALTANAMATDEQKCFSVGMDAFLSKPIQQDHLVRVILATEPPAKLLDEIPDDGE